MSLGSLLQLGVMADSQVISASAPASELIWHAEWSASTDADLALGSVTGSVVDVGVSAGWLDMKDGAGGDDRVVYTDASTMNAVINSGCVRIIWRPQASQTQILWTFHQADNATPNRLFSWWNGSLNINMFNDSGTAFFNAAGSAFSVVGGCTYEIETNWEISASSGAPSRAWQYANGVMIFSASAGLQTRASNNDIIVAGHHVRNNTGFNSDSDFRDMRIFSEPQHSFSTSSYTPDF